MAVCEQCGGEMMEQISCLSDPISARGELFEPIRWGRERENRRRAVDFACRDCSTPPGGVHHPGCCVEQCPACLGQALGCPCFGDPDEDLDELDGADWINNATTGVTPKTLNDNEELLAEHIRISARCRSHVFLRHYRNQ